MTREKSLLLIEIARWTPDPQTNLSNNVTLTSRYAFFGVMKSSDKNNSAMSIEVFFSTLAPLGSRQRQQ